NRERRDGEIQESKLEILPFEPISRPVESQPAVKPGCFPPNFDIIDKIRFVGRLGLGCSVCTAGAEALRIRCVDHYVVSEVIIRTELQQFSIAFRYCID